MEKLKAITSHAKNQYQKDGFCKISGPIFTEVDFRGLKAFIDEILRENDDKKSSTAITGAHLKYPKILFWILSDNFLNIAEDFLGPNIGLWSCSVFYKKAHSAEKAYWHKDIAGIYRYELFEDKNLINLTLSISAADRGNGCLRYIPGTQNVFLEHNLTPPKSGLISNPSSISEDLLDTSKAVYVELNENQVSVHNVNVVHGSEPNTSNRDRITLSCRFFSASSRCYLERFRQNYISPIPILVRGQDVTGSGLKRLSLK